MNNLEQLQARIRTRAPKFEIRFKDESLFMKILGKILFFNKSFMTRYITTIGDKVYWPSRKKFEDDPTASFIILAHEYVHIMDYINHPMYFTSGYAFPQILAIFALLSVLAFISPWFLFFLFFLLFLAPIPAPIRKWAEMRGYGMTVKLRAWFWGPLSEEDIDHYSKQFTTSAYYFMWPFEKNVKKELRNWANPDDLECFNINPAYEDVYNIIKA